MLLLLRIMIGWNIEEILKGKETNLNIKILESPNFISYEVSNKIFHVISQFAK